jgi:hypothetical protein
VTASAKRPFFRQRLAITLVLCLLGSTIDAANETGFLTLWQQHIKHPEQHDEIIAACRNYVTANPADELVRVVQGVEAWHLLTTDQQKDAVALLESHLSHSATASDIGAANLAKAWLSRLDLEGVKQALQHYYRKEVGYPVALKELTNHPGVPPALPLTLVDRWDQRWDYRLTGFQSVPGFRNQRYSIGCDRITDTSDITEALALPYAATVPARPKRVRSTRGGSVVVEFVAWRDGREHGPPFQLGPGRMSRGLLLAYCGNRVIIICDLTHWYVLPKPR